MEKNLIFKLADEVAKLTFKTSLDFSQKFQFSIGEQLRRSSLSIVLNIVEGGARVSGKEKRQFLNFAFGSLKETKYLLYFSLHFGLINKKNFDFIL